MSDTLTLVQIATIKTIVDDLAALGISPLHLRADAQHVGDTRINFQLWARTRTDFEALCAHWKLKATEKRYVQPGQREWWAEKDTDGQRLLVQCVSFAHHDDWEPRDA